MKHSPKLGLNDNKNFSKHETSDSMTPQLTETDSRFRNFNQLRESLNMKQVFSQRQKTHENQPHFRSYKLKLVKKPINLNPQLKINKNPLNKTRKFNFDKLIKLNNNNILNQRPININIQNININNYNYYTEESNHPILIKRKINTAEIDNFPIITNTCPSENMNIINSNNNIFKSKIKRIKLVDLKKLQSIQERNKKNISANSTSNYSNVKLDKQFQNKKIEIVDDINDSFIDELTDILRNVEINKITPSTENSTPLNNSDLNFDKEPSEIQINTEIITQNNYQARPQTSYGGIKDRRKNMRRANGVLSAQLKNNLNNNNQ